MDVALTCSRDCKFYKPRTDDGMYCIYKEGNLTVIPYSPCIFKLTIDPSDRVTTAQERASGEEAFLRKQQSLSHRPFF